MDGVIKAGGEDVCAYVCQTQQARSISKHRESRSQYVVAGLFVAVLDTICGTLLCIRRCCKAQLAKCGTVIEPTNTRDLGQIWMCMSSKVGP